MVVRSLSPHRTERDRRRYDVQSVPDIIQDLDKFLAESYDLPDTTPIDRWVSHLLYNAFWRIQEEQNLRRQMISTLEEIVRGFKEQERTSMLGGRGGYPTE